MRSPLGAISRSSVWHRINHAALADLPVDYQLHLNPNEVEPEDLSFARRLLASFRLALDEETKISDGYGPSSGTWAIIRNTCHGLFYEIAARGDIEAFAHHLANALHQEVCFGLGPGPRISKIMRTASPEREELLLSIFDNLVSCAEAIGALPVECPELGRYGVNLALKIEDVVARIEAVLGRRVGRPPVMGMTGISVEGRVIDNRLADDLYCASRLRVLSETFSRASICEIGGGFGGLADEAVKAGLSRYTIADLPVINVIQAFFLMKVHGPGAVSLFGEPRGGLFDIIPYWEFYNPAVSFDFVVNRDSMPEMPLAAATGYLGEIERRKAAFLSVNQESAAESADPGMPQLNISTLAKERTLLNRLSRHRYWTRSGYVEEFYLPASI